MVGLGLGARVAAARRPRSSGRANDSWRYFRWLGMGGKDGSPAVTLRLLHKKTLTVSNGATDSTAMYGP